MNEKVKEFLTTKQEEENKKFELEKQKTLVELGLYEKVYSENSEYSPDFPNLDYEGGNNSKWFKKVGIEVSDKEYEEIKKYAKKDDTSEINPIATALTVIAWVVFIGGFIAGIALGNVEVVKGSYYTYTDTEFSFAIAFTYWCVALISGMIFLGFAEVIKLLEDIKNK